MLVSYVISRIIGLFQLQWSGKAENRICEFDNAVMSNGMCVKMEFSQCSIQTVRWNNLATDYWSCWYRCNAQDTSKRYDKQQRHSFNTKRDTKFREIETIAIEMTTERRNKMPLNGQFSGRFNFKFDSIFLVRSQPCCLPPSRSYKSLIDHKAISWRRQSCYNLLKTRVQTSFTLLTWNYFLGSLFSSFFHKENKQMSFCWLR